MDEKEKQLDTELDTATSSDGLEEKDGVKYETNDNWKFDAETPTLSDNLFVAENDATEAQPTAPEQTATDAEATDTEATEAKSRVSKIDRDKLQIAILAVLVAAIIALVTFLGVRYYTVPNGKEGKKANPAAVVATIEDTKISIGLFNYYYTTIVSNYEQYASNYGIDTSADYASQYTTDSDGNQISWLDFFEKTTFEQMKTIVAYYNAGVAEGIELNDNQKKAVDNYIENFKTSASSESISLNEYLEKVYGKYCTEDTLRTFFEQYLIGLTYQGYQMAQTEITDEDIMAYFNDNKSDYSMVDFSFIAVKYDATDDKTKAESDAVVKDYMNKITDRNSIIKLIPEVYSDYIAEDVAAAMESDKTLTKEEATKQAIDTYTQSIDGTINSGSAPFGDDINEWFFSPDTPIGAKTYYVQDSIGYAYILLKTGEPVVIDEPTYAVRHILVQPKSEDENTQPSDCTDEQWAEAEKEAQAILDDFNAGDKAELTFAKLAEEKTTDTASTTSGMSGMCGGLYEAVEEGQMVKPFEEWSFDSSRKYGDTGIVKTDYGYHIMFFVYQQPTYKAQIINKLKNDKVMENIEGVEVKPRKSNLKKAVDNFYSGRTNSAAE